MFISLGEEEISFPLQSGGKPLEANVVPDHKKNEIEQKISNLQEEILELKHKQRTLDEKRRESLNKILDIKGSIRVFCRVRPLIESKNRKIHQPVLIESNKVVVKSACSRKEFGFDKVFPQEASQEDVFVEVEPILRSALDGHNVCVLAYGQTGTGKTFTMEGTNDRPGIVLRVLNELFHQASLESSGCSYTFSISMMEAYLGNLRDLLAPKPNRRPYDPVTRCNLNIQTDTKGSVEIEGLMEVEIPSFTEANWWYTKGRRVRSTSWTNVNETSSRSHCLTRITISRNGDGSGGKPEVSKLWMVDLGGTERLLKTGATGQTLDEGRAINLSLSALGDVIAGLRKKRGHVPYRNSKLTQILRDSLGDGSKVLMLLHISQSEEDVAETTCSLTFAKRASAVETNKELPEDLKKLKEKKIAKLEEDMRCAEEECQEVRVQLLKTELLLKETKRLISHETGTPTRRNDEDLAMTITPRTPEISNKRSASNSLPRFMNSTAASRHRKITADQREIVERISKSGTRISVQVSSGGHSVTQILFSRHSCYGTSNFSSHKKAKTSTPLGESTKCNVLAYSDPNSKTKAFRQRRRMSDFI